MTRKLICSGYGSKNAARRTMGKDRLNVLCREVHYTHDKKGWVVAYGECYLNNFSYQIKRRKLSYLYWVLEYIRILKLNNSLVLKFYAREL